MRTEYVTHHARDFVIEARGFQIEETHEAGFDFVQLWLAPQAPEQIEALHSALSGESQHTGRQELDAASRAEGEALQRAAIASGGTRPGQRIIIRAAT